MSEVVLRRYKLPSVGNDGWALIVIGSDGFFSAVSDYGNYAYIWGAMGCEVRKFLIDCEPHYFWSKITHMRQARVFDEEQTEKNINKALWDLMGEGEIDKVQYDEALEALEGCLEDQHTVANWADSLTFTFDWYEGVIATKPEPQSWAFANKVLPRLQAMLREELALESNSGGTDG